MRFVKMRAIGNDYVVLDVFAEPGLAELSDPSAVARRLCDRRLGVGADGLLLVAPPLLPGASGEGPAADAVAAIINADGSAGGACGNGLRCVARLAVERGYADPDGFGRVFIAMNGRVCAVNVFLDDAGRFEAACVDLGRPTTEAGALGLRTDRLMPARGAAGAFELGGHEAWIVDVGNPHAVVFSSEPERLLWNAGPLIERHPAFPDRANVHFVRPVSSGEAVMLSWERGVGHTPGCGTGAGAALVAGVMAGRLERSAVLRSPGGELVVRWDAAGGQVFVTGPAHEVFTGEIGSEG